MHQNKRWSPTLRHLVKLILGCHIVRLPLPTLHLEQTLGEWRKTIQENEYNGTFNQSGHQTQLTFILPLKMEISKEGSTILAFLSCFFILFYFQLFLFCVRPKETFLKIQSLQCRPSNHDLTWSDIYEWVNSCHVKIDKLANVQILPSHK